MLVNGCDCSIVVKTQRREMDIPYSDETLREAVSFLQEEAPIEGDGARRGILKNGGVTGCVVTPLTIGTAPLLLYLAMGAAGSPAFVSETRDLYKHCLELIPKEDTENFDLIQSRSSNKEQIAISNERKLFEGCRVVSYELRIMREEAIKLKLDITSERPPVVYPYTDSFERDSGERFRGDCVTYTINGQEIKNIYGITLTTKKDNGTKTELSIKRIKEQGEDIPEIINEITITATLLRDRYEHRYYGTFQLKITNLFLVCDESNINAPDAVIGPMRYFVSGSASATVFTSSGEAIK